MPLSNVNISLKQFQDISCGKFNAGEVRLRGAPTSIPPNPSALSIMYILFHDKIQELFSLVIALQHLKRRIPLTWNEPNW